MSEPQASTVAVTPARGAAALSKGQKTFNRLIKKIEEQRRLLQTWQDTLPRFLAKRARELDPLRNRYDESRARFVHLLDAAHDRGGLTRTEQSKLSDIIASIVSELLSADHSEELVALYDKHNDVAFAEEEQMAAESAKAMVEDLLGVGLGDEAEIKSRDDLAELLNQKMLEQYEAEEEARARQRDQRKLSAKALAREARLKEEARGASQSLREVFRKLASALHPDRESEAAERQRKTVLMQRVNAAYGKNDLLTLLQLQLEAEQIGAADISAMSDARLKHYNKVLAEQLAELEDEIASIAGDFSGGDPFSSRQPHPAMVLQWLDQDIAQLKAAMTALQRDLLELADIKKLKARLKGYRISSACG